MERDRIVTRFREALEADVDEDQRTEMIYELHKSMQGRQQMYLAVGDALGSRYKNAVRKYVQAFVDRSKPERLGCDCDGGCSRCIPRWVST